MPAQMTLAVSQLETVHPVDTVMKEKEKNMLEKESLLHRDLR